MVIHLCESRHARSSFPLTPKYQSICAQTIEAAWFTRQNFSWHTDVEQIGYLQHWQIRWLSFLVKNLEKLKWSVIYTVLDHLFVNVCHRILRDCAMHKLDYICNTFFYIFSVINSFLHLFITRFYFIIKLASVYKLFPISTNSYIRQLAESLADHMVSATVV